MIIRIFFLQRKGFFLLGIKVVIYWKMWPWTDFLWISYPSCRFLLKFREPFFITFFSSSSSIDTFLWASFYCECIYDLGNIRLDSDFYLQSTLEDEANEWNEHISVYFLCYLAIVAPSGRGAIMTLVHQRIAPSLTSFGRWLRSRKQKFNYYSLHH